MSYILIALVITNVYKGFTVGFDQTLLYFGAPALCGLKAASLVSIDDKLAAASEKKLQTLNAELGKNGRGIINVKRCGSRTLFFCTTERFCSCRCRGKRSLHILRQKTIQSAKASTQSFPNCSKGFRFRKVFRTKSAYSLVTRLKMSSFLRNRRAKAACIPECGRFTATCRNRSAK